MNRSKIRPCLLVFLAGLFVMPCQCLRAEVRAYPGTLEIPVYPWWPPVRHPFFRATDGRNIYPYPMLDNLKRTKEPRLWRTVVLENEYLRVTFLPEMGGKIYEVLDKTTLQSVFYVNHVAKPGLIGQCGAWVSGGIEFNTGPAGHTVSAVQPVEVEILPANPDGSRSVAVGEVERINRTHWTVVVTLRPGRSYLEERIRIYNPNETVRPYYFWNCTAMPNTPGFRFIYPMTLGTDHGGNTFYTWPMANGKDLSLGRSYEDASSIFAYQCDQDFFGSYDEDADRGVVAYANHHQVPGKKAWTWGHGSYGTMHQMDLTDKDGPYNEVQTGPLPTQADVGRLDPGEAVSWQEWWYPVHGIGSFSFANRDLAVNAQPDDQGARLRLIGTGTWAPAQIRILRNHKALANASCNISPQKPADIQLVLPDPKEAFEVEISKGKLILARFRVPLDLPVRTPPQKPKPPQSSSELAQAGWRDFLFAKFPAAESRFRQALAKDAQTISARTGLAFLNLERDPAAAVAEARAALTVDPDLGSAHFVLAAAELRLDHLRSALEQAWKAALDPATAVPARALVAKILLRQQDWAAVIKALAEPGPWTSDPTCRNRLALAWLKQGEPKNAQSLARQNLEEDPLDAMARSLLWLVKAEPKPLSLGPFVAGKAQAILDLAAEYADLGGEAIALRILDEFYLKTAPGNELDPLPYYWAAYLSNRLGKTNSSQDNLLAAQALSVDGVFPHRHETILVLRWALEVNPNNGKAALLLGHLLFSLDRHAEGRRYWQQALESGVAPAVACRALAMACQHLDNHPQEAMARLEKGNQADPADPIVAMDLARVLVSLADKAEVKEKANELVSRAGKILAAAFEGGKNRSDFVALLARAHNQLGEYAETARLLDSVRITIWEGAREAHNLFEEAHLALGNAYLKDGHPAQALAEFNRALEYPENLATGKMQNTREAHIHYLRGNALAALGQKDEAKVAWKKAADERPSNNARTEEARKKAAEALNQPQ